MEEEEVYSTNSYWSLFKEEEHEIADLEICRN